MTGNGVREPRNYEHDLRSSTKAASAARNRVQLAPGTERFGSVAERLQLQQGKTKTTNQWLYMAYAYNGNL